MSSGETGETGETDGMAEAEEREMNLNLPLSAVEVWKKAKRGEPLTAIDQITIESAIRGSRFRSEPDMSPEYLGDAVYYEVTNEGMVRLTVYDGITVTDEVFLDDGIVSKLYELFGKLKQSPPDGT